MKRVLSVCLLVCAVFCTAVCISACSGKTGYGVVLWSIPEHNLNDGDIVPVYERSNISKVYIIGIPGSGKKIEVPLWRITEPESKRKARKTAQRFAEYRFQYARAALDGLPIRAEPGNTAKQVYRLRLNEVIKILYKGEGQAVMSGKNPLQGDWLRVLTSDGSLGWCFSYNLRIFNETDAKAAETPQSEEKDTVLKEVLTKRWVPDFYKSIIDGGKIDLERIRPEYGFNTGAESGNVSICLDKISKSEIFRDIKKTGTNIYSFTDTPFTMLIQSADEIVVRYIGSDGIPVSYSFISLEKSGIPQFLSLQQSSWKSADTQNNSLFDAEDSGADDETQKSDTDYVTELIACERTRRLSQYRSLASHGPVFVSSNYGSLILNEDQSFIWTGFRLLLNSEILPQSLGRSNTGQGTVEIKYFIASALERQFDGVLTFIFNSTEEEVNFLYKAEETGLRLEHVGNTHIGKSTVHSRSNNPLVLFFAKQ